MGSSGTYFDADEIIQPIQYLTSSAYAPLWDIYESVRLSKYTVRAYIRNASMSTEGALAAMLFRDVVPTMPNRFYERLIVEPGRKTGRPTTVFTFNWVPIEPSDYEFYDHTQVSQMDGNKYGQINLAGIGLPNGFTPELALEFTLTYEFKSLIKPPL